MRFCIIHHTLNDGCLSLDPILSAMSMNMKLKYKKYWENMDNINFMIYVAFIRNPRFKMMALEFWLEKCSGITWANEIKGMMRDLLKHLMEQYNKFHVGLSFVGVNINSSNDAYVDISCDKLEDNETQFRKMFYHHVEKVNDLQCRFELD